MNSQREPVEERLQICLEQILSGRQSLEEVLEQNPDLEEALHLRLEAALWLTSRRKALEPRPGFISASRRRLVDRRFRPQEGSESARTTSSIEKIFRLFTNRFIFQASLVALVVMALLVGNLFSAAAQNTIPGDFLYPLKSFSEGVQIATAVGPARKARLHLQFARRRVTETEAIILEGRADLAPATLANFDRQAGEAVTVLRDLRMQDPEAAQAMALALDHLLDDQAQAIELLSASVPGVQNAELTAAVNASEQRISEMQLTLLGLGVPGESVSPSPTPRPGQTVSSTPGSSSTPLPAQAGGEAATDTPTRRPSLTPRPTNTLPPVERVKVTDTPTPTFTSTVELKRRPTLTSTPTFTPTMVIKRRPTLTPRPTNPNRPTPKPTKTSKP